MAGTKKFSSPPTVLSIAGTGFRISFFDGSPSEYEPCYLPFVSTPGSARGSGPAVEVGVHRERTSPSDAPIVFESGGAWNIQMGSQGYRLNFHREDSTSYHTVACSDSGTRRVRVYIDQDEFTRSPSVGSSLQGWRLSPVRYPLDQLLLMNHLAPLGGVIVHGAGIVIGERAVVFPGASGAGKSTLSRLFMDAGLGDSVLSDDRVILRTSPSEDQTTSTESWGRKGEDRQVDAWGTPWPGEAEVARNESAPLDALLFLVKADSNELRPLSAGAAARRLMPVVTCPWYDPGRLSGVLETCSHVVENAPCFELLFRADAGVVEFLADKRWASKGGLC